MSSKFWYTFSRDVGKLLQDTEEYNVIVKVGDDEVQNFRAHSILLRARCPYFKSALSSEWAKKEGEIIVFRKPNISPRVFEIILGFIYTGTIDLDGYDIMTVLDLLVASDELLLNEVSEYVQEHLLERESDWLESNLVLLWGKIHQYASCRKLQEYCLQLICRDPLVLFGSRNFLSMEESLLVPFLKLDGLQMEEVELWDFVLQWGISRNPGIDLDHTNWSKEDFEALRHTLRECIPLIDFAHISSRDFYDKVWPFKVLLPEDLLEGIVGYHFKPSFSPPGVTLAHRLQLDSALIRPVHVAMLSSWIDYLGQRRYIYEEAPYRLQLLLRGTRDGFDAGVFHDRCDERGRTIVVMRVKGTEEIIGGYNPIMWMATVGYSNTEDSFLFSFGNRGIVEDSRLSRVSRSRSYYAIQLQGRDYGPCFGDKDLSMRNKFDEEGSCSCQKDDYSERITDVGSFAVDEYEVFRVIRRC